MKLSRRNLIDTYFRDLAPYIALTSFAIAAFALAFSIRGDRRKTGIDIRCDFSVASSVWSSERWVAGVRLENLKDRQISIYKIYLEVGHGLYIEVEDFTETPLSLDAYSVYQKKYDPIKFYSVGMRRVTGFLDRRKTRACGHSLGAKSKLEPKLEYLSASIEGHSCSIPKAGPQDRMAGYQPATRSLSPSPSSRTGIAAAPSA